MPEDSKKSQHKPNKNDAKEQRKPRRQNQQTTSEKKAEKKVEEPKTISALAKPASTEPGQEFYKNLKRETDEILKITEEASSKFKKKEIQSNWAKYEMPIESYEEIDEQDNLGADYEKLIQTPMSIGGHFQFKHEKSWDVTTGPSPYDKYFEVDMDNLANALNCIPFYERNGLDPTMFSEGDRLSMDHRATKYKRKYYNEKSLDAIETKIIESLMKPENEKDEPHSEINDVKLDELPNIQKTKILNEDEKPIVTIPEDLKTKAPLSGAAIVDKIKEYDFNESNHAKDLPKDFVPNEVNDNEVVDITEIEDILSTQVTNINISKNLQANSSNQTSKGSLGNHLIGASTASNREDNTIAVVESPEDLEKWLDDFLDG